MLITWKRHICEEGDEQLVEILGGGIVVPDCCDHVRDHLTVTLAIPYEDLTDTPACVKDAPDSVSNNDASEATGWTSSLERWLEEQPEEVRSVTRFDVTDSCRVRGPETKGVRGPDEPGGQQVRGRSRCSKIENSPVTKPCAWLDTQYDETTLGGHHERKPVGRV